MSRAELIIHLMDEHRGKAGPVDQKSGPAAPTYDSRAEAEKSRQVVLDKKDLTRKDMAKIMNDIRGRHPKPGAAAPIGGILPPARHR